MFAPKQYKDKGHHNNNQEAKKNTPDPSIESEKESDKIDARKLSPYYFEAEKKYNALDIEMRSIGINPEEAKKRINFDSYSLDAMADQLMNKTLQTQQYNEASPAPDTVEKIVKETPDTIDYTASHSTVGSIPQVDDSQKDRTSWANLPTEIVVTQKLGLNYEEVKRKFKEVNGNLGNTTLLYWIRESIINGWSDLSQTPPNIRDIEVIWKTEEDRGEMVDIPYIKAFSYEDAFAKAGALGLEKNVGAPFYWVKKIQHLPDSEKNSINLVKKSRYEFAKSEVWVNLKAAKDLYWEGAMIEPEYVVNGFFEDIKKILGDSSELTSISKKSPWMERYRNEELIVLVKRLQRKKYQIEYSDYELRKEYGYDQGRPKTPAFTGLISSELVNWVKNYESYSKEREKVNSEIRKDLKRSAAEQMRIDENDGKTGYVVWVHWRQNYDGTRTELKRVMRPDPFATPGRYTYLQAWHFTDIEGNDHYYADRNPYEYYAEDRGYAGESRIDFLDDQWQYFLALDIVDKEETRAQAAMLKGGLKIIFAVVSTIATAGLAAPFWATAGILTATYSFGKGINELVAGAKLDQEMLDKLEDIPDTPMGLYGRAIDNMIGTKGHAEVVGEFANTIMMVRTVKWNSSEDIKKAFTKSGYLALKKMADNADYIGFVYSIFGLVNDQLISSLTDYDKERLESLAKDIKQVRTYYHKIRNARY